MPSEHAAAAIRARVGDDWSVFDELSGRQEPELRSLLRSHREAGFTSLGDGAAIALRRRLDDALDRLMLLELAIELGVIPAAALPVTPSLPSLLQSGAFARYLNSYLYFGARFAARRILGPSSLESPPAPDADRNDLPVALPDPPDAVTGVAGADEAIPNWLASRGEAAPGDLEAALDFLDDFLWGQGEQAEYELWLHGLSAKPELASHFEQVTRGLLAFARAKAAFYMNLEGQQRMARWQTLGFARDTWTAKHPLSARFGVLDLYWLARLLREIGRAHV